MKLRLRRKRKTQGIFGPPFSPTDLGFSPMQRTDDGQTMFKCDVCKCYKPADQVTISVGDGFVECEACR